VRFKRTETMFRILITVLIASSILVAQIASIPTNEEQDGEAAFQTAIRSGLQPGDIYSASVFVLNHENIAIPILLGTIAENLADKSAQRIVSQAAELIAYAASDRGMDAIAALCSLDSKRFAPFIDRLLNRAINRDREYEIVYHALDADPDIRQAVVRWLEDSLTFPQADVAMAKEVLRREKAGHFGGANDTALALLPAATRDRVLLAVEKARSDDRARQNDHR
jgi:hypothetical protein